MLELDVTGIAHGGVAVARHDGRVVFVADAIPGERVRARVSDDRKRAFWRAETVEVLEPSPDRVAHVWPEAGLERDPSERPGGAEFGHIALGRQRELKADVLEDALRRFGGVARRIRVESAPGDDELGGLGWRTRVRLHVDERGRPGPMVARSHRVARTSVLPLAAPAIVAADLLGERFVGEEHVDAIATGDEVRLVIGRQTPTVIVEHAGGRAFRVDDTGFWQVHREAPGVLASAVREAVAGLDPAAEHLDLYGGVGLLGAVLAEEAGPGARVVSVEADARATGHAATNLAEWSGASAETARVDRWLRSRLAASGDGADRGATVVLDPPRAGAGRDVLEPLAALGPARIVLVACDPVAFGRDVGLLAGLGYGLGDARAIDLFPHTHHVETIGVFDRG